MLYALLFNPHLLLKNKLIVLRQRLDPRFRQCKRIVRVGLGRVGTKALELFRLLCLSLDPSISCNLGRRIITIREDLLVRLHF